MLIISLLFSLVVLASFDTLSTAIIASSAWALFSYMMFNASVL